MPHVDLTPHREVIQARHELNRLSSGQMVRYLRLLGIETEYVSYSEAISLRV